MKKTTGWQTRQKHRANFIGKAYTGRARIGQHGASPSDQHWPFCLRYQRRYGIHNSRIRKYLSGRWNEIRRRFNGNVKITPLTFLQIKRHTNHNWNATHLGAGKRILNLTGDPRLMQNPYVLGATSRYKRCLVNFLIIP